MRKISGVNKKLEKISLNKVSENQILSSCVSKTQQRDAEGLSENLDYFLK